MKVAISHDSEGNISALVAYPGDAPPAYIETESGHHLAEIEVPEILIERGPKEIFDKLRDLAANSRVDIDNKARLTKK
jgi:hypothetical protein